jgi:hypothetical protein
MAEMMYREALNRALIEEMERDPLVFVMGEGIAERGGSYKVTEGLLKKFGPERVIDTRCPKLPLQEQVSERTYRPVLVEISWISPPSHGHDVNQATSMNSCPAARVPMV